MKARHNWLTLVSVAIALFVLDVASALAQCNSACLPQMKTNWPDPHYTVYLDGSLNATERQAAINGMNMWNQWFQQNGEGTPFYIVTSQGQSNLLVFSDPTLHNTGYGAGNAGGAAIGVNPDYANESSGFWNQVLGHEFGHSVGFKDVYGSCSGMTIMYGNIPPGNWSSSYMTHLTGVDDCALDNNYPPPNQPPPVDSSLSTALDPYEPLILDLDGTGIQTSGSADPVWFDLNADGVLEHITWTKAHTNAGFLWIDLNHNGKVDNGSELFGIGTTMPDGTKAHNGFEALAMYDDAKYGGNGDGVISAADEVWNHLRIWIDWNHNGVCDPGESGPIHEYGIESIPLGAVINFRVDANGNTHMLTGTYFKHVTQDGPAHDGQYLIESLEFQPVP